MKLLGIQLRRPSFNEVTVSAVMAAGLWLAAVGVLRVSGKNFDAADAGAMLLIVFWGCVCARMGIRVDRGPRHLALNVLLGGALLSVYQAVLTLLAG
jgi:hypothetical protein